MIGLQAEKKKLRKKYLENTVTQVVEALRYKPEYLGFDSRFGHWDFQLTESFWLHCVPGVDSPSNRNEYQRYLLGVKTAGE
jgi:hypothetical protein